MPRTRSQAPDFQPDDAHLDKEYYDSHPGVWSALLDQVVAGVTEWHDDVGPFEGHALMHLFNRETANDVLNRARLIASGNVKDAVELGILELIQILEAREVRFDYSQDPVLQYLAQKWLETDWLFNDKERVTWRQVSRS